MPTYIRVARGTAIHKHEQPGEETDDPLAYQTDNGSLPSDKEKEQLDANRQEVPDAQLEAKKKRAKVRYARFDAGLHLRNFLKFEDHLSYKFVLHRNERGAKFARVFASFCTEVERQIELVYRETRQSIDKIYPLESFLKHKQLSFNELVSYSTTKNAAPML